MSQETKKNEECKDDIYQLSVVSLNFTQTLHAIVLNALIGKQSYINLNTGIFERDINGTSVETINEQLKNINEAFSQANIFSKVLDNTTSFMTKAVETLPKTINTKQTEKLNIARKDTKQALECLIFGFIRQQIENKTDLIIPFYLKMICLQFYGDVIMTSNILNINQINTIQYVLSSNLYDKQYYFEKICDSKNDGFNAKKFNLKYRQCQRNLIVIKTNGGYIGWCYFVKPVEEMSDFNGCIGCALQSPISTVPFVYQSAEALTFYFPNDFEANRMEKLSDVAIKVEENKYNNQIQCGMEDISEMIDLKTFCDKMMISDFEVFTI